PLAGAGRARGGRAFAPGRAGGWTLAAEPIARLPATAARLRSHGAQLAWSAYLAHHADERRKVLGHFSYMALDAPLEVRADAGLDEARVALVRAAMLAERLDEAAALLPDALVDVYAIAGDSDGCAGRIAALAPWFDLFVLPMNDVAGSDAHIRTSAGILRTAAALSTA